jgi:hypothetical protein
MPKWALLIGVILVAIGLFGYFGTAPDAKPATAAAGQGSVETGAATTDNSDSADTGKRSATPLIPAAVGMLLLICGTLGLDAKMRKHAMHAAAGVAALGFLAALGRLGSTIGKIMADGPSRATWFLVGMLVCCGLYVFLSVQSFRQARKARNEGQT